ncbi:ABC-2 family transporter protein [Candidatus Woesearchaeota archaeon]|nr:ABC-2 family transporter protein [Candidatus Woesearchaeota archaeon]
MSLLKFFRIEKRTIGMALAGDMAYKMNFYLKCFAVSLADLVSPVLTVLIYSATLGIPGWTMHELLLFQGTLMIVFGLGHTFTIVMPYEVINNIREGEFDKYLIKPFNVLLYLLAESFYMEGLAEIAVGIITIVYSMATIGISFLSFNFLFYLAMIIAGFAMQIGIAILISSLAFLVVKSDALMHLYFKISDFVRYPLSVYTFGIQFFFTFLLPIGVSSFYPSIVLLRGVSPKLLLSVFLPVIGFVIFSIFLWNWAIKSYTSAGG